MERLPKDVLEQVFFHLPLPYLVRCLAVCTQWKHLLSSPHFLHHYYSTASRHNKSYSCSYSWVALVHERHPVPIHPRPSPIHIYDPQLHKFLQLDLSFAPSSFTIPVPASQGLLCLSSLVERNFLCLCNPLTKSCKFLPKLENPVLNPLVFVVEGPGIESRKVLVIADEIQALYTAEDNRWVKFGADTRRRLRSAVIASNGLIYGVEDEGYGWDPSWRLVCSEINGGSCWKPVKHNWGDMSDVLKGPCLIRGRRDCFCMAGGLRSSLSLNSTCSTFVILEFDLNTLEWKEAGRMPAEFFRHFDRQCEFSIFGGKEGVYFSGRKVGRLVFWDACEECWNWMDDCALDTSNALCGGFVFEPRSLKEDRTVTPKLRPSRNLLEINWRKETSVAERDTRCWRTMVPHQKPHVRYSFGMKMLKKTCLQDLFGSTSPFMGCYRETCSFKPLSLVHELINLQFRVFVRALRFHIQRPRRFYQWFLCSFRTATPRRDRLFFFIANILKSYCLFLL